MMIPGMMAVDDKAGKNRQKPQMRYKFRITAEGLMLLVVMVLVGFAAWHSNTNLLYLIFAILLTFYLFHGGLLWLNLSRLAIAEVLPETVIVDQPFDIEVKLANNKKRVKSSALIVAYYSNISKKKREPIGAVYFAQVPRRSEETRLLTSVIKKRGYHDVSSVQIATRYPFGFEERALIQTVSKPLLALPATYNVGSLVASLTIGFGDRESVQRGSGTDIYGLREYVQGDQAKAIHWRTSARAQKLMVSEYSRDERRKVMLVLDNGMPEESRQAASEAFEKAITLTASLARHLIADGYEVGLQTLQSTLPEAQGAAHLLQILKHLAVVDFDVPGRLSNEADSAIYIQYDSRPREFRRDWKVINSITWTPPGPLSKHGESL